MDCVAWHVSCLTDCIRTRIGVLGFRSYFPAFFDRDNELLSCLGMEIYVPNVKLIGVLQGELNEFDALALEVRVRLVRY